MIGEPTILLPKLVEKAWDSGDKWLTNYFKNHQKAARENVVENAISFLNDFAQRIKQIEDNLAKAGKGSGRLTGL
jgi:hypothetical protein